MCRPLVMITIAFTIGIVSAAIINPPLWIITSVLAAFLPLLVYAAIRRIKISFLFLFLIFLSGLFDLQINKVMDRDDLAKFAEKGYLTLTGQICEDPKLSEKGFSFPLNVKKVKYKKHVCQAGGKIYVSTADPSFRLNYGDEIEIRGVISAIQGYSNPLMPQSRQIYSIYSTYCKQLSSDGGNPLKKLAIAFSRRFNTVLNEMLPPKQASLLGSILLGSSVSPLEDGVKYDYRKAGLIHLLVVSGTQVSILIGVCLGVTRALSCPLWLSILITSFFNLMLVVVTGGGPSILRAAIMGEMTLIGLLFEREKEFYTALCFSALVLLIITPLNLFDIGFQLSFAATWALVYIAPVLEDKIIGKIKLWKSSLPKFLSGLLAVSLAPILATSPIIAYNFSQISAGAIVSNLLVLPWVEFLVVLGFSTTLLGFIFLPAAKIFAGTIWLMLALLEKISAGVGKIPGACFYIENPSFLLLSAYYIGLIVMIEKLRSDRPVTIDRGKITIIGLFLAVVLVYDGSLYGWVFRAKELTVTFIDVGQGDAVLIETPQGKKILIDGGGMESRSRERKTDKQELGKGGSEDLEKRDRIGTKVVIPFLQKKGINRLDLIMLTHPHEDHMGGLNEVLKEVKVDQVADAGSIYDSPSYRRFKALISANNIKYTAVRAGRSISFGGDLKGEILGPGFAPFKNINSDSVVMRLAYGRYSFLFTGDMDFEEESFLLKNFRGRLTSTILKVGHHGSATSTGDEFLRAVKPKYAVISVGKRNRYRHPATSALKRLFEHAVKVFRTDMNGAVTVRTDGYRLAIETQK